MLFVPGNRPERFEKAFSSGADAICIDLEDAVNANDKAGARGNAADALATPQDVDMAVRLNAFGSQDFEADVERLSGVANTVVLSLPKAHLKSIQALAMQFPQHRLIALLEDAQGIEEAYQIAEQPSVVGLLLGAGDLAAQLGVAITSWEALLYSRSRLLLAAVNANCLAMDVPCVALRDTEQTHAEALRIKQLGYCAKAAIHPDQIEPIHRALAPDASEIAEAKSILDAFEKSAGNAVSFNGKMLDEAILKSARRMLALGGVYGK